MSENKGDLISREAFSSDLEERYCMPCKCCGNDWAGIKCKTCEVGFALDEIEEAPAVDAVEVVRCKDCKHWNNETGWCNTHSHFVTSDGDACHPWESDEWKMFPEDYYCADGERKEGDGNADK